MDLTGAELRILLQICVDREHECYRNAWLEFERRYGKVIKARICNFTKNREDIGDILQDVLQRLTIQDFRALKNFRAKHSERAFIAWLNIISRSSAWPYIRKPTPEQSLDDFNNLVEPPAAKSEKTRHEKLVAELRKALASTKKDDYAVERDILIYLLRYLYEFESKEVAQIPLLDVTPGNVDNIVNRLSNLLRKNKNQLRDS